MTGGSIWMSGIADGGNLHLAAMTYRQRGKDFVPGPVSNDPMIEDKYDFIAIITESEVLDHIVNIKNG